MSFVTFNIQLLPGLRVKTVKVTKKWGVQMGGIIRGGKKLGITALSLVLLKL